MGDPYVLHTTLEGHDKAINYMSFSTSGEYLATGGDDGMIQIWNPNNGILLHSIEVNSPIICLEWDPTSRSRLFCGCHNGLVVCVDNFGKTKSQRIQTGVEHGQVYALALDDTASQVGISIGPEIHIATKLSNKSFATFTILPEPNQLPNSAENSDGRVRGRSLKFVKRGTRLIVSYLNHGIVCWDVKTLVPYWTIVPEHLNRHIGNSALSPDGRSLLASNLDSGMDLYSLETFNTIHTYQYTVNPQTNYPLSVAFLKRGKLVVCGTHTRNVTIWDRESEQVYQTLDHGEPFVKCLTSRTTQGYEYLATATTSNRPKIKIWRAARDRSRYEQVSEVWNHWMMRFRDASGDKPVQDFVVGILIVLVVIIVARYNIKETDAKTQGVGSNFNWLSKLYEVPINWMGYILPYIWGIIKFGWITATEWLKFVILRWLDLDGPRNPHSTNTLHFQGTDSGAKYQYTSTIT